MKKGLFSIIAVFALSMLAPRSGIAEPTHPNEIGLYTEPHGYGETGTNVVGAPVTLYLVLTKPEANDVPTSGVIAFNCQLNFSPIGGIFRLGDELNGEGFNIGEVYNINLGYLEYIVSFGHVVPAIDEAIHLVTLSFVNHNTEPVEVTMGPTSIPFIPDQMSFGYPSAEFPEVMYSMGGSHDAPVFIFNGEAVPAEQESFGSVKALYR